MWWLWVWWGGVNQKGINKSQPVRATLLRRAARILPKRQARHIASAAAPRMDSSGAARRQRSAPHRRAALGAHRSGAARGAWGTALPRPVRDEGGGRRCGGPRRSGGAGGPLAPGWLGGALEVAEGREGVLVIPPALAHLDACLEEDLRPVRRQGWLIEARERWATESSGRDFEARFGRGGAPSCQRRPPSDSSPWSPPP